MNDDQTSDDAAPIGLAQDLEEAKALLTETEEKLNEMTTMAQRSAAELQNFKRRTEEEKGNLKLYANLQFLQVIFPVIDNFQRAFSHMPEDLEENEWVKGIVTIEKQFIDTLTSLGLSEIPCEVGVPFDPNLHEVLAQDAGDKDAILECFEKGYSFNDMVVRPAKVKVGNGQ
jgi:molecular chaperone GrpE